MPNPQIPLTGNIGTGGVFPLINSPTVNFATDANHTMVWPEMSGSSGFLKVTSSVALTATRNLVAPLTQGFQFTVENATTGGEAIQVIGTSGTGVTISNGSIGTVVCDGANYASPVAVGAIVGSPLATQIITQPPGSDFAVVTSATGLTPGIVEFSGSYIGLAGTPLCTVRDIAADYTITTISGDYTVVVDATSNDVTVTLPAPGFGTEYIIKRNDASSHVVTVNYPSGTINGASSFNLTNSEAIGITGGGGTDWLVTSDALVSSVINAGTLVLTGGTPIAAGGYSGTVGVSINGVSTSTVFVLTPTVDESTVTGWGAAGLRVIAFYSLVGGLPGVEIKAANPTASPITPGSITFNIRAIL